MMQEVISISTSKRQEMVDITKKVESIVKKSKIKEGVCHIFAMHSTAAIIINESYDPDICLDLLDALNGLVPKGKWRHDKIGGNADAHIKASILGPSEMMPIREGKLQLGRWQSPMLVELDGPRAREIVIKIIGD